MKLFLSPALLFSFLLHARTARDVFLPHTKIPSIVQEALVKHLDDFCGPGEMKEISTTAVIRFSDEGEEIIVFTTQFSTSSQAIWVSSSLQTFIDPQAKSVVEILRSTCKSEIYYE